MFRLRRKSIIFSEDTVQSELYDERSFYRAFARDIKSAKESIIIESPYLTERRALQFVHLFKKLHKRGVYIRLNTREPKHHDKFLEIQAWKAIKVLRKAHVKIYLCSDMRHRKLAIIDSLILWDGSLNILSQSRSREIMRRSQSLRLCRQMITFTKIHNRFW